MQTISFIAKWMCTFFGRNRRSFYTEQYVSFNPRIVYGRLKNKKSECISFQAYIVICTLSSLRLFKPPFSIFKPPYFFSQFNFQLLTHFIQLNSKRRKYSTSLDLLKMDFIYSNILCCVSINMKYFKYHFDVWRVCDFTVTIYRIIFARLNDIRCPSQRMIPHIIEYTHNRNS